MSDCTAIYPAKPIECLRDAGHDGDHAGQDDAGFQVYWSKPNADMVPAARLDAANLEIARLKAGIQKAASRNCDGCWKDRESKKHGHHDHCEARRILADCGLPAALTPKEPSDG